MREVPAHSIVVENLAIRRGGTTVIVDLDLSVLQGEVLAIRGPSGVGKTTLLGALCGLLTPWRGSIEVLGQEIGTLSDSQLAKLRLTCIGLVFQSDELLSDLTLLENITLPLRLGRGSMRTAEYATQVQHLMDRLEVGELAERFPDEVSGGQLQRAAVARAVVHDPAIVLADEPTGNLDEAAAADAMRMLIGLAREQDATVLVVTHDDDVAALCDRQIYLSPHLSPTVDPR